MIYDPLIWFNPGYMMHCGFIATKSLSADNVPLSTELRKAIEESFAASVLSLGINQLQNIQLRVQLVNPNERSPDIRVMHEIPTKENPKYPFRIETWDIEVVTLGDHSDEQVDDFLKHTKLTSKKSYDKETIILCYINKDMQGGKLWHGVSRELKTLNTPNNIFLLGKTHPINPIYQMARVNPAFDAILRFNLMDEVKKKYDKPGGTLFAGILNRKPQRKQRRGINPFLED